MNLKEKAENWLMNVFAGKILARAAVSIAGAIVGAAAAPVIAGHPLPGIVLDQVQISEFLVAVGAGAGHAIFEWFKAKRMANPLSPTVQTDPAKAQPAP